MRIAEDSIKSIDFEYGNTLDNLGVLYYYMGDFINSEKYYLKEQPVRLKIANKKDIYYAFATMNLGIVYNEIAKYKEAELSYFEAMAIYDTIFKVKGLEHSNLYNNIAIMYKNMGEYEKAEPYYKNMVKIKKIVLGESHPEYGKSLNNLAELYRTVGQYTESEDLYLKAQKILETSLGENHVDIAPTLQNIANLYVATNRLEDAKRYYIKSKNIREKTIGIEHPEYALGISNLAIVYNMMNNDSSEFYFLQAQSIYEKKFDKNHFLNMLNMSYLAYLYEKQGRYQEAETIFINVNKVFQETLGKGHVHYAFSLYNLAFFYTQIKNYKKASHYYILYLSVFKENVINFSLYNSENKVLQYILKNKDKIEFAYSFNQRNPNDSLTETIYNTVMSLKNSLLESHIVREKSISKSDTITRNLYYSWKEKSRQLADKYTTQLPLTSIEKQKMLELQEEVENLEKEVANRSRDFALSLRNINIQKLSKILHQEEVAIEFLSYRYHNDRKASDSIMYVALVLGSGDHKPRWVTLCEQQQLDTLLNHPQSNDQHLVINRLYNADREDDLPSLYNLLWKPLEPYLKGVKTVYYADAGDLYRINFEALAPTGDSYLSKRSQLKLVKLISIRQLDERQKYNNTILGAPHSLNKEALLFGDIYYNMTGDSSLKTNRPFWGALSRDTIEEKLTLGPTMFEGEWPFLKGSKKLF